MHNKQACNYLLKLFLFGNLYNKLSNNSLYKLYFSEPITTIIGGPDMFINKGSTMNLTCIIKHSPEPPPLIYWTHDSKVSFFFETLDKNDFYESFHRALIKTIIEIL